MANSPVTIYGEVTDSIVSAIQSYIADIPVSPRTYDAIVAPTLADGDYTTLKQALDAGKIRIAILPGTYDISDLAGYTFPSNLSVDGYGAPESVILNGYTGSTFSAINLGNNNIIQNVRINDTQLKESANYKIRYCTLAKVSTTGTLYALYEGSSAASVSSEIQFCKFKNIRFQLWTNNILIQNNTSEDTATVNHLISIDSSPSLGLALIYNNIFSEYADFSLNPNSGITKVKCIGNTMRTLIISSGYYGGVLDNLIVDKNHIIGSGGRILINSGNDKGLQITDNVFDTDNNYGIYMTGSGIKYSAITGNVFANLAANPTYRAIRVLGDSNNVSFNLFPGVTAGYEIDDDGTNTQKIGNGIGGA